MVNQPKTEGDQIRKKHVFAIATAAAVTIAVQAADRIVIDGSTTVGPIAKAFAEYFMTAHPDVNITVSESGSGNGAGEPPQTMCI